MLLATALVVVVLTATVGTHHLFDYGLPWGQFATVGLAASGVALSLRTRTPNLAFERVVRPLELRRAA
jgi:hypothetical protein